VTPTAHWLEMVDWAQPILKDELVVKRGRLKVPDAPGTGIRWNEKAIARHAI